MTLDGATSRPPARPAPTALGPIFEPRSIAVVGASANPAKRGHQILRALGESGYSGRVHAVNRAGGEILGQPVHRSLEELPEAADLAVICTPGRTVPDLVRACGERGIAGAVVLAVGFGESGADGARLESRLLEAAREGGVRVVGPNTSGLLNLPRGVNLIGARGVRPGGIALLVQSGNIALDLMTQVTEQSGMGISICAGLGNEVDVGFGEVLEYLGGHDETRVIVAHIEGCRDSRALLAAASTVARRKPVVAIKSDEPRPVPTRRFRTPGPSRVPTIACAPGSPRRAWSRSGEPTNCCKSRPRSDRSFPARRGRGSPCCPMVGARARWWWIRCRR